MASHVSIAECFKRHVFDSIPTAPNLLNHVRKQGAQIQLVTSTAQTKPEGMVTQTLHWEVRQAADLPATAQNTFPAVTQGKLRSTYHTFRSSQ